jgi:hypothetical protein
LCIRRCPKGATATNVQYKIYTKGKPADGLCSATNKDNPCFLSDPINQSNVKIQDTWVDLTSNKGVTKQFEFSTSADNGAYVGLSVGDIAKASYVGVDAIQFLSVPTPVKLNAPTGLIATIATTVAPSVSLKWADNSIDETGFTVQRKLSTENDSAWKTITAKALAANTTTYTDANLAINKTYNYRVSATSTFAFGNSDYSNVAVVSLSATNHPPTATPPPQALKVAEDTTLFITLNGADADKDALTYIVPTQPANGTLSALNVKTPTYTPKPNFFGTDSFKFKVNDGKADSAEALVSITVTPVNDLPQAKAQSVNVTKNTLTTITLEGVDVEDIRHYSKISSYS